MKKLFVVIISLTLISHIACGQSPADTKNTAAAGNVSLSAEDEQMQKDFENFRKKLKIFKNEMDLLVKDVMSKDAVTGRDISDFSSDIKIDITQNDKSVIVRADLPGMEKDKINVSLENDRALSISGERDIYKEETSEGVVKKERTQGKFERTIELPVQCKSEGISATYKNGVLEIVIPKEKEQDQSPVKILVK